MIDPELSPCPLCDEKEISIGSYGHAIIRTECYFTITGLQSMELLKKIWNQLTTLGGFNLDE